MERIFYYIRVCTETSDIVNNMIFSPVKVNNKGEIMNPRSAVDRLMLFYAIWLTKSAYFAKRMKEFAFNISCSAKDKEFILEILYLIITVYC